MSQTFVRCIVVHSLFIVAPIEGVCCVFGPCFVSVKSEIVAKCRITRLLMKVNHALDAYF